MRSCVGARSAQPRRDTPDQPRRVRAGDGRVAEQVERPDVRRDLLEVFDAMLVGRGRPPAVDPASMNRDGNASASPSPGSTTGSGWTTPTATTTGSSAANLTAASWGDISYQRIASAHPGRVHRGALLPAFDGVDAYLIGVRDAVTVPRAAGYGRERAVDGPLVSASSQLTSMTCRTRTTTEPADADCRPAIMQR